MKAHRNFRKYYRPNEVDYLLGDPSKVKRTQMGAKMSLKTWLFQWLKVISTKQSRKSSYGERNA